MGIRVQIGDEPSFLSSLSLIVASVVMFASREISPSSNDTPSSPCCGEGFFSVLDRIADPQHADPDPAFFHVNADPDQAFSLIRIRILILLLIKVMKFYDYRYWYKDPLWLHFESPRIRCEHSRPLTVQLNFEPLKLLKFDFNVGPDQAFHSNAVPDSDSALQNNADPYTQPWLKRTWISDQCC
jgi:hypothetical protein